MLKKHEQIKAAKSNYQVTENDAKKCQKTMLINGSKIDVKMVVINCSKN
jgi:hypothetical protein